MLHSETALVANGSCQWPCIDKLPPKCSWCDLCLPSLTSQPTSWKKVMTSQTDRKRQAEIAAAGADSVMMGGNRWQPALSLQDRYSTTGDLKGSSRKLERWEYREIHRAWSGFYFSGCLLFLVYSYSSSSQPEYFTSSFRSVTFFYGLPWKICQAAHGSAKWQKPTRKHKGHVFMPLNCLARC